jgi:hypothetical protein
VHSSRVTQVSAPPVAPIEAPPLREELALRPALALFARAAREAAVPLVRLSLAVWLMSSGLLIATAELVPLPAERTTAAVLGWRLVQLAPSALVWALASSVSAALVLSVASGQPASLFVAMFRGISRGVVPQLRLFVTMLFASFLCGFPALFVLTEHYVVGAVAMGRDLPSAQAWSESARLTSHRKGLVFGIAIIAPVARSVATLWVVPWLEDALWAFDGLSVEAIAPVATLMLGVVQALGSVLDGMLAGSLAALAIGVGASAPSTETLASTFE